MSKSSIPAEIKNIFTAGTENTYETKLIQSCYDMVDLFVAAVDKNGNICLTNKKATSLLEFSVKEITGQKFIDKFVVREDKSRIRTLFRKILDKESVDHTNTTLNLKTGNYGRRIIEARITTIRDETKSIQGVLISGNDITEYLDNQHGLPHDINLYRILANMIPGINLFLFDRELRFIIA